MRGNWNNNNNLGRGQGQEFENEWNNEQGFYNYPVGGNGRGRGGNQNEFFDQNYRDGYQNEGMNQRGGYERGNGRVQREIIENQRQIIENERNINNLKEGLRNGGRGQNYNDQRR